MRRLWLLAVSPFMMAAREQPLLDPGPSPTFAEAIVIGDAAIRRQLVDPDSAKIDWPYNFSSGTLKALLGKTRAGWFTCGYINAKNRMGGFTGRTWFMIMINAGSLVSLDIGQSDGIDAASASCPDFIRKGIIQPAPIQSTTQTTTVTSQAYAANADQNAIKAASKGGLGISFVPTPIGALIISVAPDSIAAKAGLKVGMTVERVNDVLIKGMSAADMISAVGASTAVQFKILGSGDIKVR